MGIQTEIDLWAKRANANWDEFQLTRWMMPAAVSHTEMKMEMSWASLGAEVK